MTSIAILEAVNTQYVPFNGQQIITAMVAGAAYVAMRPIVENLGMDWATQLRKLKGGAGKINRGDISMVDGERGGHMTTPSKYGCCDIAIPSKGGIQQMLCIPLRKLNGWLFSINPEKVRADIRDKLIQYQEECFSVLHDYWNKGVAVRKSKTAPGKITQDQQMAIKELVKSRGQSLPKEKQAKAMITMWSAIKNKFGITYKEIDEDQFTEALSLVSRIPLDGEFLGKQEALPEPKLEINIPIQWWIDNNPAVEYGNRHNIARSKKGLTLYTPSLDVTMDMLCGDNSASSAIHLINILEEAGHDVSAPKAEIVALRKHLANVEYGMKAIADACKRAGSKTLIFRGSKADIVIS